MDVQIHQFVTSTLYGINGQLRPGRFIYTDLASVAHTIGDCVGARANGELVEDNISLGTTGNRATISQTFST